MRSFQPFDSEPYRRAMMYWRIFEGLTIMTPQRRQECLELYYFWRERAIQDELIQEALQRHSARQAPLSWASEV